MERTGVSRKIVSLTYGDFEVEEDEYEKLHKVKERKAEAKKVLQESHGTR